MAPLCDLRCIKYGRYINVFRLITPVDQLIYAVVIRQHFNAIYFVYRVLFAATATINKRICFCFHIYFMHLSRADKIHDLPTFSMLIMPLLSLLPFSYQYLSAILKIYINTISAHITIAIIPTTSKTFTLYSGSQFRHQSTTCNHSEKVIQPRTSSVDDLSSKTSLCHSFTQFRRSESVTAPPF